MRDAAALITKAKALATPVTSCIAASLRPDHLLSGCTWDEMAALVVVLAESADLTRLRAVVEATEDGPVVTGQDVMLRKAHAEVERLRRDDMAVPARLMRLEREYQRRRPRPRQVAARQAMAAAETANEEAA